MKKLGKKEMLDIKGGGINIGLGLLIGAGIVFIIGLIDGFVRPLPCN